MGKGRGFEARGGKEGAGGESGEWAEHRGARTDARFPNESDSVAVTPPKRLRPGRGHASQAIANRSRSRFPSDCDPVAVAFCLRFKRANCFLIEKVRFAYVLNALIVF